MDEGIADVSSANISKLYALGDKRYRGKAVRLATWDARSLDRLEPMTTDSL